MNDITLTLVTPPGTYSVDMYTAETYTPFNTPGSRVFSFTLNGALLVADWDPVREVRLAGLSTYCVCVCVCGVCVCVCVEQPLSMKWSSACIREGVKAVAPSEP
jgi:Malectin domain